MNTRARSNANPDERPSGTWAARRRHVQRELSPPELRLATGHNHTAATILRAWLDGKAEHTIRGYRHDLEDFAVYFSRALGISVTLSVADALTRLFQQSSASAHEIALGFRSHLVTANLSTATVNRHLATLRSATKLARMLGVMTWYLEVPSLRAQRRRDTRGPAPDEVRKMLAATSGDTESETRDAAILLTLYCLALRVSEVCGLRLEDTDLAQGRTLVKGKGRRERDPVPLPAAVVAAIRRYLNHRGLQPGPLFRRCGRRATRINPLATRSVLRIVHQLGRQVGLHVGCHSLRHSSITTAAELGEQAGLGLHKVRVHSRHRSIATLMIYVDEQCRTETQRSLSDLVAGTLTTATTVKSDS